VSFSFGCSVNSNDKSGFAAAVAAATSAEYAVLVMGIDQSIESEGTDRTAIDFPGMQNALMAAILAVQPKTVLVLVNGGSLDLTWASANIPAIVEAFYPGEEGGNAIADVLFGLYSPNGRLPITFYPAAFTDQISMFSMDMRQTPGKTYRFYTGTTVYPFGYGLSYSTFSYVISGPKQLKHALDSVTYTVTVANTGTTVSDVSVLGFLSKTANHDDAHDTHSQRNDSLYVDTDCPMSQLFDFQKINLWIGQSQVLTFTFSALDAGCYDNDGNHVAKPGTYELKLGDATTSFIVPGAVPAYPTKAQLKMHYRPKRTAFAKPMPGIGGAGF